MLAVITTIAIVVLILLAYFWPMAVKREEFRLSRIALCVALIGSAVSEASWKWAHAGRGVDWVGWAVLGLVIGWIALLIGLRGIFALLVARGDAASDDGS